MSGNIEISRAWMNSSGAILRESANEALKEGDVSLFNFISGTPNIYLSEADSAAAFEKAQNDTAKPSKAQKTPRTKKNSSAGKTAKAGTASASGNSQRTSGAQESSALQNQLKLQQEQINMLSQQIAALKQIKAENEALKQENARLKQYIAQQNASNTAVSKNASSEDALVQLLRNRLKKEKGGDLNGKIQDMTETVKSTNSLLDQIFRLFGIRNRYRRRSRW